MKKTIGIIFWALPIGLLLTKFLLGGKSKPKTKNEMINETINNKFRVQNDSYISKLNPVAKSTFISFISDINALGYAVVISSGYRDSATQARLKKENPKNASAGFSLHEYGLALDLNLVKDGIWYNKNTPIATWNKTNVPQLAKTKYKMRWGGDFQNYSDTIHFDLGNKYDVNKLYAMAIKIYGSADKIEGNKLNLA